MKRKMKVGKENKDGGEEKHERKVMQRG